MSIMVPFEAPAQPIVGTLVPEYPLFPAPEYPRIENPLRFLISQVDAILTWQFGGKVIAAPLVGVAAVIAFSAAELSWVNVQSTPKSRTSTMSLAHALESGFAGFSIRFEVLVSAR